MSLALTATTTAGGATTCATAAACVFGANVAAGPGVLGTSAGADGVDGKTSFGGTSTRAASGIAGLDLSASAYNSGVFGNSRNGQGVHGSSTTGTGVFGGAANGTGVSGVSTSGTGVLGQTKAKAAGNGVTTAGVVGSSTDDYGVFGVSTNAIGMYGTSLNSSGVYAETVSGAWALTAGDTGTFGPGGILGTSTSGIAIEAYATGDQEHDSGTALVASANAQSDFGATIGNGIGTGALIGGGTIGADISSTNATSGIGIVGRSPAGSGSQPLLLTDSVGNTLFYVDGNGDVYYHGTVHRFAATRNDALAKTYAAETTAPSIEDVGSARLVNGQAVVKLDAAFAQTIDPQAQYHVFLTPNGDTRGLFIASKSADRFVVRETQGGHATLAFDFRVVAATLGHGAERTALVSKAAAIASLPHAKLVTSRLVRPKLPPHVRLPVTQRPALRP